MMEKLFDKMAPSSSSSSTGRYRTPDSNVRRSFIQKGGQKMLIILGLSLFTIILFGLQLQNMSMTTKIADNIPDFSSSSRPKADPDSGSPDHGFVYDGDSAESQTTPNDESVEGKPLPVSELDMVNPYSYLKTNRLLKDNVAQFSNPENEENPLIDFDRGSVKYLQPEVINYLHMKQDLEKVDWSRYAYVLYATSGAHLCNSFMVFAELRKYGSKADMVLIVNEDFLNKPDEFPNEHKELMDNKDKLRLKYSPVKPITIDSKEDMKIWVSSYTKLLVFGEISYDRIIYMDADSVLLAEKHLDELFFIPPCQVATPAAYWLIDERFGKMGEEAKKNKYPPEKHGFQPLTAKQRLEKISKYIASYITPFLDNTFGKLTHLNSASFAKLSLDDQINYKNTQNAMYNALPSYPYLEDYKLTNIIMVIQPSQELFDRIKMGIATKSQDGKDEYDMDIIERLFDLRANIVSQSVSLTNTTKSIGDRIKEIPEYMILPPKTYAALTLEFNVWTDHNTFSMDSTEQAWSYVHTPEGTSADEAYYYEINKIAPKRQGEYLNPDVKYLHFSDAPIPKPWWFRDPKQGYMSARTRCPEFEEFHKDDLPEGWVLPRSKNTDDCSAAKVWEWSVKHFEEVRKEVCGLELARTDKNTYFDIIN